MSTLRSVPPHTSRRGAAQIALLEDDLLIAEVIGEALAQTDWRLLSLTTISAICEALQTMTFDLLILDWSLPDGDADEVIRLVRHELALTTPILIVSLNDDEQQIVHALDLGADDYVVKPLRIEEIKARIASLLRRHQGSKNHPLRCGPYQIDVANHDVALNGKALGLTALEYNLASYFFQHVDELLSREELLTKVWERNSEIDTRTVDAHISRLRKKLRLGSGTGMQISTLRGYGYRLEAAKD